MKSFSPQAALSKEEDAQPSQEHQVRPDKRRNDSVRFRVRELPRIFRHRHGDHLPPDDKGRDLFTVYLSTIISLGGDQSEKIASAFELVPWMPPSEREDMVEMAVSSPASWTADELALRLNLTMDERTALRIGSIGAVDCDREARLQRRAQLHRERQRELRRKKSSRPKSRPVQARAEAVLEVLPRVMEVPVKWISQRVEGKAAFKGLKPTALKGMVRATLKYLETREFVKIEVRSLDGSAKVAWVIRLPRDEAEYRRHFDAKLRSFDRSAARMIAPWFNSERRLRERCGLAECEQEFQSMAIARRDELVSPAKEVLQTRRAVAVVPR
jgi:hypothetical protein